MGETLDKAVALAPLGSAPVREEGPGAEREEGRLVLEEARGNTCWYCGGCRVRSLAGVGTKKAEAFNLKKRHERDCGGEITCIGEARG